MANTSWVIVPDSHRGLGARKGGGTQRWLLNIYCGLQNGLNFHIPINFGPQFCYRTNTHLLKSHLKDLGATEVVDESESAMFGDTMSKVFEVGIGVTILRNELDGFMTAGARDANSRPELCRREKCIFNDEAPGVRTTAAV